MSLNITTLSTLNNPLPLIFPHRLWFTYIFSLQITEFTAVKQKVHEKKSWVFFFVKNETMYRPKPTTKCNRADGTIQQLVLIYSLKILPNCAWEAVSIPVGCSDHNLTVVARRTNVPKSGQRIIFKRMFQGFHKNYYYVDVWNTDWSRTLQEEDPDLALEVFTNLLLPVMDEHAPERRQTVRNVTAPWLGQELKEYMTIINMPLNLTLLFIRFTCVIWLDDVVLPPDYYWRNQGIHSVWLSFWPRPKEDLVGVFVAFYSKGF